MDGPAPELSRVLKAARACSPVPGQTPGSSTQPSAQICKPDTLQMWLSVLNFKGARSQTRPGTARRTFAPAP